SARSEPPGPRPAVSPVPSLSARQTFFSALLHLSNRRGLIGPANCSLPAIEIKCSRLESGQCLMDSSMANDLSHFDEQGASRMVDVGAKPVTSRMARASGRVVMQPATLARIQQRGMAKGDVLEVARLAGIMAAKRTGELIPLCHPLGLDSVELALPPAASDSVVIEAVVKVHGRTGVEMEALTAVSVAALTV